MNDCSLSGALLAALIKTAQNIIKNESIDSPIRVECPVNLRPLLGNLASAKELGCFYGLYLNTLSSTEADSFWNLARKIRASISTKLRSTHFFEEFYSHQVAPFTKMSCSSEIIEAQAYRGPLVGLSNLGQICFDPCVE